MDANRNSPALPLRLQPDPRRDRRGSSTGDLTRSWRRSAGPASAGRSSGALGLIFGWLATGGRSRSPASLSSASLGLWEPSMATLALTLAAVFLSLLDRHPAGDPRRPQRPVRRSLTPGAGLHADHADVRLPRAAHAVLPDRPGRRRSIVTLIYADPAGDPASPRTASAASRATVEAAVVARVHPLAGAAQGAAADGAPDDRPRHQPDDHGGAVDGGHHRPRSTRRAWARTSSSGLDAVDVGAAFNAGLAIVMIAIVLDRLTDRGRAPRVGPAPAAGRGAARRPGRAGRARWRSSSGRSSWRACCPTPTVFPDGGVGSRTWAGSTPAVDWVAGQPRRRHRSGIKDVVTDVADRTRRRRSCEAPVVAS